MTIDLTSILINLSNSLLPVQSFLSGLGYLLGVLMMISGLMRLKKLGNTKGHAPHGEGLAVPLTFLGGGGLLVFLPSTFGALSNTVFGATNILSYSDANPDPFRHALELLIQTAGLLWFVRGTVLLVHASEPGEQEGPKGMTFLIAGIFAMNFNATVQAFDYAFANFFVMMTHIRG